ncbi:MAG TPA: PfkB family carbohydrate kinase [Thermoanaerobaculia bacterium]|nr:PfkB family carbohydrate kinase [Thermoanaerobaculia bacterium]
MYDIVSVGGIATDLILRSPKFPSPGTCVTATELRHGLGGKGANQAVAAARLGGRVALVGRVGDDDAGRSALARLSAEGVAVDRVTRDRSVGTGAVVIHRNDAEEKQAVVFPGANARLQPEGIDAAALLLASARVVLVQLEIPLATVERVLETVRAGNAQLILDVSPVRALPPAMIRAAAVIKANAAEATAVSGIRVRDVASARAAAARLLELGARLVAIEAGPEGNLFASASEEVFLPLYDIAAVDATGAGDTLVGAFAVAMVEGQTLREAARFACAAAALATRQLGAQTAMPTRAELEAWLAARQ